MFHTHTHTNIKKQLIHRPLHNHTTYTHQHIHTPTYTHTHTIQNLHLHARAHTHTHTPTHKLQTPHIHTPTHYKTHLHTNHTLLIPYIHKPLHKHTTHTHSHLQTHHTDTLTHTPPHHKTPHPHTNHIIDIYIACFVPFFFFSFPLELFSLPAAVYFTVYALCSNIQFTGYVILPAVWLLLTVSACLFVITVNCNADLTCSSVQGILKKIIDCYPLTDLLFTDLELSWPFAVTALE